MKTYQIFLIISLFILSCSSNPQTKQKDHTENRLAETLTAQEELELLMDSLASKNDSEAEKLLMDKIWRLTYITEIEKGSDAEFFSLHLSVKDSRGKQVANKLSIAEGEIKVVLTVSSYEKSWSKTIEFTPIDKENLYLLMRE